MIRPRVLKFSQLLGDGPNLRMALNLTNNFVRYLGVWHGGHVFCVYGGLELQAAADRLAGNFLLSVPFLTYARMAATSPFQVVSYLL